MPAFKFLKRIYINLDPPAAQLRKLIHMHGGEYHIYYKYGTTTYTVATHLAAAKAKTLRKEEKIIHPRWLTDRFLDKLLEIQLSFFDCIIHYITKN